MRAAWFVLIPVFAAMSTWAQAEVVLSDDFEEGVRGDVWIKWPEEGSGIPMETLHTSDSVNHTPEGTQSARAWEADPAGYAAYADFGATPGTVRAETWIYDPFEDQGLDTSRPVSIMVALIGAGLAPTEWTDYLQLGVISWYDPQGRSNQYYIRTRYRDDNNMGTLATGVFRKEGWTKLAIEADAYRDGGAVRFYIDDQLVGESKRACRTDLQFIRLGVNFKTYDNIWYDDVVVDVEDKPVCASPRFDADGDGDVDQEDFGVFQTCFSGAGAFNCQACRCMDADVDGDVDHDDLSGFTACISGPTIPASPDCDAELPLP